MNSVRRPDRTSRVSAKGSFSSEQGDLFQQLQEPAPAASDLDINPELLGAVNTAIRDARAQGLGRERIVELMNKLLPGLERPITLRQLNAWTAVSKEFHEFPARYLAAFCVATGCDLPLRALAQPIGMDLVDARDLVAKRLGENLIESARLARERTTLKQRWGVSS